MRYIVKWVKDGERRAMLTRETVAEAVAIARALLETRPSDIWIESPDGQRAASYEDIIEPASARELLAA